MKVKRIFQYGTYINRFEEYDGEFGFNQIDKPYFSTSSGNFLAHDILEHPKAEIINPVIDEIYAITILYFLRQGHEVSHYKDYQNYARNLETVYEDMHSFHDEHGLKQFTTIDIPQHQIHNTTKYYTKNGCQYFTKMVEQAIAFFNEKILEKLEENYEDQENYAQYKEEEIQLLEKFNTNVRHFSKKAFFYYNKMYPNNYHQSPYHFFKKLSNELSFLQKQAKVDDILKVYADTSEYKATLKLIRDNKTHIRRIIN